MPELEHITETKPTAAPEGLAPIVRGSGQMHGKRTIIGGLALRRVLIRMRRAPSRLHGHLKSGCAPERADRSSANQHGKESAIKNSGVHGRGPERLRLESWRSVYTVAKPRQPG